MTRSTGCSHVAAFNGMASPGVTAALALLKGLSVAFRLFTGSDQGLAWNNEMEGRLWLKSSRTE